MYYNPSIQHIDSNPKSKSRNPILKMAVDWLGTTGRRLMKRIFETDPTLEKEIEGIWRRITGPRISSILEHSIPTTYPRAMRRPIITVIRTQTAVRAQTGYRGLKAKGENLPAQLGSITSRHEPWQTQTELRKMVNEIADTQQQQRKRNRTR